MGFGLRHVTICVRHDNKEWGQGNNHLEILQHNFLFVNKQPHLRIINYKVGCSNIYIYIFTRIISHKQRGDPARLIFIG